MLPKKLQTIGKQQDGNIIVTCRFRPLNEREKERSGDINVEFPADNKTVVLNQQFEGFGVQRFNYDFVFAPGSEQKKVYESTALPIVEAVMQGFNGTVFAYGQTSSGKTFTMSGPDIFDEEMKGIIPRMVTTVFDRILKSDESSEFLVKIGFCEIYNEKIKDLIDPSRKDLKVQEDKARGVYIAGLSEHYVFNGDELLNFMSLGQENREVASTLMNAGSSRSHSIFITTINQKSTKDFSEKTGKLFLVDLAGSEKVGKTGAVGKVLEEAKNINKSLTTLGKVINNLTDGSPHVPYRDSKLTRVLQDSLGGNSKTALIITCSPSPWNESETMSTLRFGDRAKAIKNKPKVNREFTVAELKLLISKLEDQIVKKDKQLEELQDAMKKSGIIIPNFGEADLKTEEDENEMLKELKEAKDALLIENEKNEALQSDLSELKLSNDTYADMVKNLQSKIEELEINVKEYQEKLEKTTEIQDTLEEEVKSFYTEKTELEKKIAELSFNLEERGSAKMEANSATNAKESFRDFNEQLERYKDFERKVFEAEDFLKAKLSSEEDITGLRDIIEKNLGREKSNISEAIFRVFLRDYLQEVEELELKNINLEEKYQAACASLTGDQKKIKSELERQHYQHDNLALLYNKLLNEKASFKIEQQLSRKKIERLTEVNREQSGEIDNLKYKLEELSSKISARNLEIAENSKFEEPSLVYSNVRKPIKGGISFLTKASAMKLKDSKVLTSLIKPNKEDN